MPPHPQSGRLSAAACSPALRQQPPPQSTSTSLARPSPAFAAESGGLEQTPPPSTSGSTSASPARPSTAFTVGGYRTGGDNRLVSKLLTQLGVIYPLPPSVLGIFALFFFVGAASCSPFVSDTCEGEVPAAMS